MDPKLEAYDKLLRASADKKSVISLVDLISSKNGASTDTLRSVVEELTQLGIARSFPQGLEILDRLSLAGKMLEEGLGADTVASRLDWREFEQFCRKALEEHGFRVKSNVRFTREKKRYEIDILAARNPYLLLLDCKHWKPGKSSGLRKAVENQRKRAREFMLAGQGILSRIAPGYKSDCQIPGVITLTDSPLRYIDGAPVIPIFRLNEFLLRIDEYQADLSTGSMRT